MMRADDRGVAGFFEDLPVLAFLLAGVFALVSSSAMVSETRLRERAETDLEQRTNDFADLLVVMLKDSYPDHGIPDIGSISAVNVSEAASVALGDVQYMVAFVLVHPSIEWLRTESSEDGAAPDKACSASRLLNLLLPDGGTGILEVRCVVS